MEDTVDRNAETKENDEVDRVGVTVEPDEVDRNKSTQEEESSGITFHIHPVPEGKSALLKGFRPPKMSYPSMWANVNQGVIFGRAEDVDIFLNDDTASRKHMELTALFVPTSFNIQQLQFKIKNICTRSLHLNNFNLRPGEERFINTSDILKIGQLTFTVEINPNNVYNNNTRYLLEFKELPASMVPQNVPLQPPAMPYNSGVPGHVIPPGPSQLHYNATGMQTLGLSQPRMPNGNIMQPLGVPQQGMPPANFMPVSQPYVANGNMTQPSAGLAIFPTSFPQQFPHLGHAPAPGYDYNNPAQPAPQRTNVSQFSPAVNPGGQEHVNAQDRREMFSQNTAHSPSENEEVDFSVEETQPPNLSSGTSFEETQPPKI